MLQQSLFCNCRNCYNCSEYINCGGCHNDCQSHACSDEGINCSRCASICCLHTNLSQYLADIQGTDIPLLPDTYISPLPVIIPELSDKWDAESTYPFNWIAISIGTLYRKTGLNIEKLNNIHNELRIPENTKIILVNHDKDWIIEDYWYNTYIKGYIKALSTSNINLATGFNYSLFDTHPRMMHLISMKKSFITVKELLEAGLPTVPHFYWKTKTDLIRLIEFLKSSNNVKVVSLNFTFKRKMDLAFQKAVLEAKYIEDAVGRDICWLVVGVSTESKINFIFKNLKHVCIISSRIIRAARSRRIIDNTHRSKISQYEAFLINYEMLNKASKCS